MNVYPINNINFKANYYKVLKYGKMTSVRVMTDNAENLGSKPVCYDINGKEEMIFDGKYYITKFPVQGFDYKIQYEDTGYFENQGKEILLDKNKIANIIKGYNKPTDTVLIRGIAKGLLVKSKDLNKSLLSSNIPLIIICEDEDEFYKYIPKAEGLILNSADEGLLSHFSALCRDYFSFGHLLKNEQSLKELSKFEGKFISISNECDELKYKEIAPITKGARVEEKVIVSPMRRIDRILTLDECENDTVGNKAYNLKRMMDLVKEGKLQDVIIPKAFVLPHAYLEHVEKLIAENSRNRADRNNELLVEIKDFAEDLRISDDIMIRSAFNGEDLDGYSAAGLYDSKLYSLKDLRLGEINCIIQSKNKQIAIKSREKHGIKDEEIKPSVIIQDWIRSDFSFTTYTESPKDKNKILIELFINKDRYCKPEPYQISYDKKTGEFKIEKEHEMMTEYIFDENYNILGSKVLGKSRFDELLPTLKKLVENALVLEKEFGRPQDIEGGIKAGQLYFWQTRNIVKKIVKH